MSRPADTEQADYLMSEVLFLRGQGEHPVMIAEMLHRDRESLLRLARRRNRVDVEAALTLDKYTERVWRGNAWLNDKGFAERDRKRRAS